MRISLQNNRWRLYTRRVDHYPDNVQLWCGIWRGGRLVGFSLGLAVKSSSVSSMYIVYGANGGATSVHRGDEAAALAELVQQGLRAIWWDTIPHPRVHALCGRGTTVTALTYAVPDAYYIDSWAGMPYCARRRA